MDDRVREALRIARSLIEAGIPVFAAPPCPGASCPRPGHAAGGVEYDLPPKWQLTVPSLVWLERWGPGWALAAVGGWAGDFLDEDPRNGGEASVAELKAAGAWPTVFGVQETPSGGYHSLISPIGERKVTGLLPGLDYQGGAPDGQGRGFVWIAPTVRRSKDIADKGAVRPYVWLQEPDLGWLMDFARDERGRSLDASVDGIRLRIAGWRARRDERAAARVKSGGSAPRAFTVAQMEHFLSGPIEALRAASIGSIEERANDLACTLSHFVPSMLSEEGAYDRLMDALGETAYDPMHPASQWEAGKFHDVISGARGRAPGDWYAVNTPATHEEAAASVDPEGDEVSALLGEMLSMRELSARIPPRYMIKDVMSYDSECWLIGGPGSKKSFVALDMAAHVATGKPWQGHKVNPGLVVFIVAEGAGMFGKRATAWLSKYGEVDPNRMRALPRPVQAADLKAWEVLVAACGRLRAALDPDLGMLVVVDTQARSTIGLDENKADEMGVYVRAVDRIKEVTGACVLSLHHTVKAGDTTRGSSALDGAQDTRLLLKSKRGSLEATLVFDKQKDLEQLDDLELRFEKVDVGQDSDGERMTSLVLLPADEWRAAEMDGAALGAAREEQEREVNPFKGRTAPEPWTHARTHPLADLQRWLLQALADLGGDTGISESAWKAVVEEKRGKITRTSWRDAFKTVVGLKFDGLVVRVHGAQRWTLDHQQKLCEMSESD